MNATADTLVIGAGLAGLTCALELEKRGQTVVLLEASDEVGGRVRTDAVEGFLLDRGFQVLLTAYPEAKRLLDYGALRLRPFYPGALVRLSDRFERVADPFRRPLDALSTLGSRVGTLGDKLRVLPLRRRTRSGTLEGLFSRPATSTLEALTRGGFSSRMIERFFRPFLSGIFFDSRLETSSRMFEFVFRMFSSDDTALPEKGMGEIPRQLASRLERGTVRTGARVTSISDRAVGLETGESLVAGRIVVATDGPEAARLLPDLRVPASRSTVTVYFAVERPPLEEPVLVLDGEGTGPVTTFCLPSRVSASYAPAGADLVSVSIVGVPQMNDDQLLEAVRAQMRGWWGPEVGQWRHLRTCRIHHALPAFLPPNDAVAPAEIRPGLFICGDHRENPSLQGAMASGRRAARAVLGESP